MPLTMPKLKTLAGNDSIGGANRQFGNRRCVPGTRSVAAAQTAINRMAGSAEARKTHQP